MPRCPHCRRTLNPNGQCRICGVVPRESDAFEVPAVSGHRPPAAPGEGNARTRPGKDRPAPADAHARTLPSLDRPAPADAHAHTLASLDRPTPADAHARTLPSMDRPAPGEAHAHTLASMDLCATADEVAVEMEAELPPGEPSRPSGTETCAQNSNKDPLVGHLLADKFLVQRLAGVGGVGRVYRATQVELDRPVALKLLHHRGVIDQQTAERFQREARAASRLNHPNVAAVYDFGQWEGQLYIAMEFIEGESLYHAFLRDFPFTSERLVNLMVQVCEALAAAHARGIVHRDLKPENIMIVRGDQGQEQVKLVDFGLAILVGPDAEQRLTREGIISGTPAYMSPEQAKGAQMDTPTDLYSLGVILYEQLCAQLPFTGETATDVVIKHMFADPDPPSAKNPGANIHPALESLAMDALAKDPAARPASAMEFRRRLLSAEEQIRTGQVETAPTPRKAALDAGGRETRAAAMGIPRSSLPTPRETAGQPWVLVMEPGAAFGPGGESLVVPLRANKIRVSGPVTVEQLLSREEAPDHDAVVVDLGPDAGAVLDLLALHLERGRLAGVPVVVVGPADDFAIMTRALELGLSDYVPASELARKLPKVLRRLRRRGSRG